MKTLAALILVVLSSLAATGCLGSKQAWRVEAVTTEEVRVSPVEAYRRKDRLFVRVNFTNLSGEAMTVDRDALELSLDGGPTLPRSVGTTTTHGLYTIAPNGAHAVYVDFKDDAIEQARSASLLWKGAVFAGKREVNVPPTPIASR